MRFVLGFFFVLMDMLVKSIHIYIHIALCFMLVYEMC